MSRLELHDSGVSIITKMCDGNPGAVQTLMEVLDKGGAIDPMCEPIMHILQLDTAEIYGTDIYILWNDKCDRDIGKFLLLLRAQQLGILPYGTITTLAKDQIRSIPVPMPWADMLAAVKEKLTIFNYEIE